MSRRRLALAAAIALLGLAAPAGAATTPPAPGPNVVGVPSPASASPLIGAVIDAWTTMKSTQYSHKYSSDDATTGVYKFDCTGATTYFLKEGTPNAHAALTGALKLKAGFAPTPAQEATFFAGLPAKGTSAWRPVRSVTAIRAGDIIAVPPPTSGTNPDPKIPGHSMVAAGRPLALADGSYALLVFDSTALPAHGPSDTRQWDPRNQPLAGTTRPSGLGQGTIQLTATAAGAPSRMRWRVLGSYYGGTLQIARPLS